MSAEALKVLAAGFDRLAEAGRSVEIWWRDDDATEASAALDRLLGIAGGSHWPLALAVIPASIRPSLVERLASKDDVTILVHGWRHANHAPPDRKPAEFGDHRAASEMAREMSEGRERTLRAFGGKALPVFVPPWNRIAPSAEADLPRLGYRALSCFGAAEGEGPVTRLDTHLDPVDWRGTRSLAAPGLLAAQLTRALAGRARRIGVLTHHLMFDEPLWRFCEGFADLAGQHPAVRPTGLSAALVDHLAQRQAERPAGSVMGAAA